MIRNLLILSTLAGGTAVMVPSLHEANPDLLGRLFGGGTPDQVVPLAPALVAVPVLSGRKMRLEPDIRGHFNAEFRLNGRPITGMIDTGATVVAINQSTARRVGIAVQPSDYRAKVETANGVIRAAPVTIARIELGRIAVTDVQAMVLEDRALSGTLIGMSFLSRLSRYQVQAGALLLEQ